MGLFDRLFRRQEQQAEQPQSEAAAATLEAAVERALTAETADQQRTSGRAIADKLQRDSRGVLAAGAIAQVDWVLATLRKARAFPAIVAFTDEVSAVDERSTALRANAAARDELRRAAFARLFGPRGLRIRIHALIETGDLEQALRLTGGFRQSFDRSLEGLETEVREVLGLRGRIYKQRYLDCAATGLFQPNLLRNSIDAYAEGYARTEPRSLWHGVNVLALVERAREDRVQLPDSAKFEVGPLGADLLDLAGSPASADDSWRHMSRAEVYWALRRFDEAEQALAQHVADTIGRGEGVRDIESALRQLRHVWRVEEGHNAERGRRLTTDLEIALQRATSSAPRPLPEPAPRIGGSMLSELDRRLNEARAEGAQMQTFEWVDVLQQRGRAIGLVCNRANKRGIGTGFLVRGDDLSPAWSGKTLFITNFHVVCATGGEFEAGVVSLRPDQAEIVFSKSEHASAIRPTAILWQSPVGAHDTCILELASIPDDVRPIPLSQSGTCDAITVLGHARGAQLQLAMESRTVLLNDHPTANGARAICYAAPTTNGCSGGPVLDWYDLKLIGLHHRTWNATEIQGAFPQRRNAPAAPAVVNEGILMSSIIEGIAQSPGGVS